MAFRGKPKTLTEMARASKAGIAYYAHLAGKPPVFDEGLYPQKRENRIKKNESNALTELQIQIRVMNWWAKAHLSYHLPEFVLFAIPNGGARSEIEAANFKRSGVRPGILDICLVVPVAGFHGLFVELKTLTGRISPDQIEVGKYLDAAGYKTSFQRTPEGAIDAIAEYLKPTIGNGE